MKQQQSQSGLAMALLIVGVAALQGTPLNPVGRHGSRKNLRSPAVTSGAKEEQRKSNENSFRWAASKPAASRSSRSLLSGLRTRSQAAADQLPESSGSSAIAEVPAQSEDALRQLVRKALQWQGAVSAAAINAGTDGTGRDGIGTAKQGNRFTRLSRQGREKVLLQQGSARFLRRGTRHLPGLPRSVDEEDYMYGLPKIVWVILADVMALAVFLTCIPLAILHTKQPIFEEVSVIGESYLKAVQVNGAHPRQGDLSHLIS